MEVNTRILRHKPTGILYAYQEVYAMRKDFEEVEPPRTEASEMFGAPKARAPKRAAKVVPSAEQDNADAIGIDASRNLP